MMQVIHRFIVALVGSTFALAPVMAGPQVPPSPAAPPTSKPAAPASPLEWHRSQLPCGARLISIHAPAAKRQSTFTFLPIHMGNDDTKRAQWSHLLEHMLIRSTDAEGLEADGIMFNGETTADYLRLETIAPPSKWKDALDRHARWLHADSFDAQTLEREKGMIAGEEQNTSAQGFTSKFAIAAWNQVISHETPVARVHGDVQGATIEDVAAYAKARVRLDGSVLIATIGPTPAEEVRAEIGRLFADDKPPSRAEKPASQPWPEHDPLEQVAATWDLPTRHILWFWPLPDDRPQTHAAATGIARSLMLRVRSRKDFSKNIRQALAYPAIVTQRGTFLVLDACLTAEAKPEELSRIVRECAAALCDRTLPASQQSIVFAARMAAQELDPAPDFVAMTRQLPEQLRDAVEGLWLLSQLNYEYAWDAPIAEVRPLLMDLDDAAVAEVLNRLRGEPRTLLLEPETAAEP